MIQELLGAAGFIGGDSRKISLTATTIGSSSSSFGSIFEGGIISSSTTNSPLPTKTTITTTSTSNSENQNQSLQLRCPRCESPNTKFCYYNNYNLTQPRHFCKTCRRYWTKGGALRNVPIGGGCRKNKNSSSSSTMSAASFVKSAPASSAVANKMKALAYHEQIERAGLVVSGLFDHHHELISCNRLMWNNNSQLLPVLRASSSQNPNVNTITFNITAGAAGGNTACVRVKEEQQGVSIGTHHHQVIKGEPVVGDTSRLLVNSEGTMVLNPLVSQQQQQQQQIPSNYHHQLGLLWKSNQAAQQLHNPFQMGLPVQNLNSSAGIYQSPKISTNDSYPHDYHYYSETSPADHGVLSNDNNIAASAASSATTSSKVTNFLESAPVPAGGDSACWNPVLAWSDLNSNN